MTITGLRATDYHTGGEPFRIVTDPGVEISGSTVASRRVFAQTSEAVEAVRTLLCYEPRGHADMYGGFITPPDDDGADFGVLFWHKDGFSTACGHGTIALGAWAVNTGRVSAPDNGITDVVIDVPSGRVTARVHTAESVVTEVDFVNVPSHLVARDVVVALKDREVTVDIGFGGAIYAFLDAASVGLTVEPHNLQALIAIGREIKWALNETEYAKHPADDRLSGIYGTIIFDDFGVDDAGNLHQRNVTLFADGEVDRSPCGSGTGARVAVLSATGKLADDQVLLHDSIVGSRFTARILEKVQVDGRDAVIPQVTGTAFRTGEHEFFVDPLDDLVPGFVLR